MYKLEGLAKDVFFDRYTLKDAAGKRMEDTPEQMWHRVAKAIANVEKTDARKQEWEEKFYSVLENFDFVPGGRILTGAGSGVPLTLYNCFVIPSPEDNRGGILDSVKLMVEIMSRGGGVGVNLSSIRPRGAYVKGVNGTASGAVSFGALYSFATGLIIQGGSRRGALMLMLDVDHPDVMEFITVKRTMGQITNANLSICISDAFMEAVKKDADWDLQWKGKVYKTVKAKAIWDLVCESAWAAGEPGLMFKERYNKESNSWYFEDIIATNPCGEQGLPAWGVCNLGAINVSNFVKEDRTFDYERLGKVSRICMRFLDNVVDTTDYFFPENEAAQRRIRRTGLGTMGLADALIKMQVRYGSDESVKIVEKMHETIRDEAYIASSEIAAEKGPFPAFEKEKYLQGHFIKRLPQAVQEMIGKQGIRNGVLLTQAPTGTTSILAGASSGIEPVYDFAFQRKDRLGVHTVYHTLFKAWKDAHPDETTIPDYFVNAKILTPEEHVRMQAAIQHYVDSSISKTVNAPNDHTQEQVQELYMKAYDLGCKGVTYFRDGSRNESVLTSLDDVKKESAAPKAAQDSKEKETVISPRLRPERVAGITYKIKTGYGTMFVTVNHDEEGKPFEVFATIGKAGGVFAEESEAICRLVSLALRARIPLQTVIEQIKGIRGPMPIFGKNGMILSIPDAIGQVLGQHMQDVEAKQTPAQQAAEREKEVVMMKDQAEEMVQTTLTETVKKAESKYKLIEASSSVANLGFSPECPECSSIMAMAEGCLTCFSCGYSKCT
ncbi:MAG: adenosylcobalamin-dependent ribonucleoside-diphosphate reductase [Candidatus Kerfeldbacteria bacterium]|nr:adenosylcobalamin-dependent ribonucleoside-diphosphate reductase [Candidatus Kerfeldbacteria bacterium]